MREFNSFVNSGKAHLKAFLGATASRLHHYILPTLEEDKSGVVIIHVEGTTTYHRKTETWIVSM